MKTLSYALIFLCAVIAQSVFFSCGKNETVKTEPPVPEKKQRTMTEDFQKALTPDDVIKLGETGNQRFLSGEQINRDILYEVLHTSKGQHPAAIIIGCIDSRAPAEFIFDAGIGDLFNARVAGNFVNVDIAASAEYACKVAGSKIVVIMGHTHCGAVKSAIDDVKLGNITELLSNIRPAVDSVKNFKGELNSKNYEYVDAVARENVILNIRKLRAISPILKEMEDKGEIKIIGAMYDIETGKVELMTK